MSAEPAATRLLGSLRENYTHAVIAFIDEDGYPLSVATGFEPVPDQGIVLLDAVAGDDVRPPEGREVNVVFSHIRPQPGQGYDERRYVSLWGTLRRTDGKLELRPARVQHWDEQEMTFFEFSERGVPQAQRYMKSLSKELGRPVKPQLPAGWLFLRTTRLPFLTATVIPIGLGIAVAAFHGSWHWWLAILTLIGGACIHLALNVANDVFDTTSGADQANVTPTQFSGGSRVILYGLLSLRQMVLLMLGFYAVGVGIGLYLAVTRAFWPLFILGAAGLFISVFYTAPPFRLVHHHDPWRLLRTGPAMVVGSAVRVAAGSHPDRPRAVHERGARSAGRRSGREAHPSRSLVAAGRVARVRLVGRGCVRADPGRRAVGCAGAAGDPGAGCGATRGQCLSRVP